MAVPPYAPLMILESFGSPSGVVVPQYEGQLCLDRTPGSPKIYQATGFLNTSWVLQSGGGGGGGVASVVAGTNVTVDDTDPANPIVSSSGGGGAVDSVVAGFSIAVDSTDPANPVISVTGSIGGVASLSGAGITATPGQLIQAGGLNVVDNEGDGILLQSNVGGQIVAAGLNAGIQINASGAGAVNIGTSLGSGTLADGLATLPLTVVTGVNDTFTYTPLGGGGPDVFTVAPGTYTNATDLIAAVMASVDSGANAFDTFSNFGVLGPNFFNFNGNLGDIVGVGPTDIFVDLGFGAYDHTYTALNDNVNIMGTSISITGEVDFSGDSFVISAPSADFGSGQVSITIGSSGTDVIQIGSVGDLLGFFGNHSLVAMQSITGSLSTVIDPAAQAVLTSIIAALSTASGYGLVTDATS